MKNLLLLLVIITVGVTGALIAFDQYKKFLIFKNKPATTTTPPASTINTVSGGLSPTAANDIAAILAQEGF